MASAPRVDDNTWDQVVSSLRAQEDEEHSFRGRLIALYEMLSGIGNEDIYRKQYATLYLLIGLNLDPSSLGEMAKRYPDDALMLEFINAYDTLIVDYNEKKGINEFNRDVFAVYTLNAFVTNDSKFTSAALSRFPQLEYLDIWPGCLKYLIKRKVLQTSTIPMNSVAEWYPELLVHYLRYRLNYRDLATLLVSTQLTNPSLPTSPYLYDLYRSHAIDMAVKGCKELRAEYLSEVQQFFPDIPISILEGEPVALNEWVASAEERNEEAKARLSLQRDILIPGSPRLVPIVLINKAFDPSLVDLRQNPLVLSIGDALHIRDLLILLRPQDASIYKHLISYISNSPTFSSIRSSQPLTLNDGSIRRSLVYTYTGGKLQ